MKKKPMSRAEAGRLGGKVRSKRKTAACRRNGKLSVKKASQVVGFYAEPTFGPYIVPTKKKKWLDCLLKGKKK